MSLRNFFKKENLSQVVQGYKVPANCILAAGCLCFSYENEQIHFLLTKYADPNWPYLYDFGGCVDFGDKNIFYTINRELKEETNNLVQLPNFENESEHFQTYRLNFNDKYKYAFCFLRLNKSDYKRSDFGEFEKEDNIERFIDWYEFDSKTIEKLCPRINLNILKKEFSV